jgi:hypothetical protein
MLALRLPVPVFYDALTTLISALIAILLNGGALLLLHFGQRTPQRRDTPPSSATVMRATAITTEIDRKWQEGAACRAEKRRLGPSLTGSLGSTRSMPGTHEADAPTKRRNALDRQARSGQHTLKWQAT